MDGELIGLPLSEDGARNLAGRSRKAPFGRNRETVVDETVRKTLEIDTERIKFQNPRWPDFIDELVSRAAHELGVPPTADVRAELYKNLLYEPGAMFKTHKECVTESQKRYGNESLTEPDSTEKAPCTGYVRDTCHLPPFRAYKGNRVLAAWAGISETI